MSEKPSLGRTLFNGLKRQCPNCGKSPSFRGYLKIVDQCALCSEKLGQYPCDDGPAYITILLVGHIVVAPLFVFDVIWRTPNPYVLAGILTAIGILTLIILPFIKGMFLNLLWHLGLKSSRTL